MNRKETISDMQLAAYDALLKTGDCGAADLQRYGFTLDDVALFGDAAIDAARRAWQADGSPTVGPFRKRPAAKLSMPMEAALAAVEALDRARH